ncbi:ABC transporter ATP-binding protein [Streptococcus chenjunshii]|uniref:ABC transporter ATP-binding protein n=1 Tax=Streptococcus chenjunshii TaxID=2173853 RepID=A0A372KLT8_9STRE|nr:ABC transporter ATP-binding protein [Streptococcus chenjunshii]AXQ79183.1 ABC transporter ATP-binding protein [Streptococcus chenjunshii]RFU50754.1 ABC transporter ATP-binding protein [Streptococcus chenjunshii]RFU52936.1 ABC transporter ATP-binding protein [Streptococcus chenjunshii]
MSDIRAENISVAYDQQTVINDLSLNLADKQITTIIGANGCGKSTLLKALTRIQALKKGQIYIDGQAIAHLPTKAVAQKIALLPQVLDAAEGISVYELVSYGRFPHQKYLGSLSDEDRSKIHWAMEVTKVTQFANMDVDSLSGGQRQRVWIAMALAQDTDTIFLDEPTTYLDMNHQLEVLELLKMLNSDSQKTIIMVLHDLNLSARFSDQLIAMKKGKIKYRGQVADIMTPEILQDIFQIDATITEDPIHKCPILLTYQLT